MHSGKHLKFAGKPTNLDLAKFGQLVAELVQPFFNWQATVKQAIQINKSTIQTAGKERLMVYDHSIL